MQKEFPAVECGKEHTPLSQSCFSFLRLDLNVYSAVYLLSEFHDPWGLETPFKGPNA